MPLPNGKLGITDEDNPLINTPFIETWSGTGIVPPPFNRDVRITNDGSRRITNIDFDIRITNT